MRIVSGKYKGKRFVAPKSIKARPTTDFAKESLFNILENRIDLSQATVLDLFAGTGSISFEFASHGVKSVTSVDMSLASYRFVNSFSHENDMCVKAIKQDVFKYIKKDTKQYDVIFADPPYALKKIPDLPAMLLDSGLLKEGGLLIVEHGEEFDLTECEHHQETREYGRVIFSFFKKD